MAMIKWIVTNSAAYHRLVEKETNALYFLEDTREIYKGAKSFTQATELVTTFPEKGAQGRIYIHETTLEGKVWVNNDWKTVIEKVAQRLTDEDTETKAVSGEAVKTYVKQQVTAAVADKVNGISFDKISKQLTYETPTGSNTVDIDGFLTGAKYNAKTGMLSFDVQGGRGIHINLPKDNFVESGRYDADRKLIVLELVSGDSVEIPAGDLIDDTEFVNSQTVDMNVSEDGQVSATVRVDQNSNNQITVTQNGLYVAPTNLDGKLDKVESERAEEIIIAKADGSVRVSGLKAGASRINDDADDHTLATEAAVAAIRTALTSSIAEKINLSAISRNVPVTAEASDDKVASERAVAVAIDELKGEKIDKTSIVEQLPEANGAVDKVASEAAVVAALSWVTLN